MNDNYNINELIKLSNHEDMFLVRRENGLKLSNYQVSVMKQNDINYLNYSNYKSLLFEIEEILNNDYNEELDIVSNQISELVYYNNTNK